MTSKSSAKGGKSPLKKTQEAPDQSAIEKELIRGLTEKDVEIDHLRTTQFALNEKVEVINDMKQDVITHKTLFDNSESKRGELQVHIKQTSLKIIKDTEEHSAY